MPKHLNVLIKIDDRFPLEKALRKFKRHCETFGVLKEYKKRTFYRKPSVEAKEKREAAHKRRIKPERAPRTNNNNSSY